jgi:hypothetical protein
LLWVCDRSTFGAEHVSVVGTMNDVDVGRAFVLKCLMKRWPMGVLAALSTMIIVWGGFSVRMWERQQCDSGHFDLGYDDEHWERQGGAGGASWPLPNATSCASFDNWGRASAKAALETDDFDSGSCDDVWHHPTNAFWTIIITMTTVRRRRRRDRRSDAVVVSPRGYTSSRSRRPISSRAAPLCSAKSSSLATTRAPSPTHRLVARRFVVSHEPRPQAPHARARAAPRRVASRHAAPCGDFRSETTYSSRASPCRLSSCATV